MHSDQTRTASIRAALTALLVIVGFATAVAGSRNNLLPNSDEIYHLLAAASYVESAEYSVGTGSYQRASLYTRYVALGYQLFGTNLTAARMVTGATFALLLGSMFLTLSRRIGTGTSLLCVALFMLSPHSLEIATTVRFYMPHALLFWVGAWSIYRIVTGSSGRIFYALVAAVSLPIAYHLQPVTLVGVMAISGWAVLFWGDKAFRAGISRGRLLVITGLLIAVAIAALVSGAVELFWQKFAYAAPWNEGSKIQYYYWMMTKDYNPFWAALPLFSLLALYRSPRVAGFAVALFAISFLIHSFAGMKEDRYIYYAMPFLFVVVSIGLAAVFEFLSGTAAILRQKLPFLGAGQSVFLARLLGAGVVAFFVVSNLGYVSSIKNLYSGTTKREQPRWDLLRTEYGAGLKDASVLVTNSANHSLYVLGRIPVAVGLSGLVSGSVDGTEFSNDRRTGAIRISKPESLDLIVDCFDDGYMIAEDRQWLSNPNTGVTKELLPIIETRMDRVDVPDNWKLRLYSWSRSDADPSPVGQDECAALQSKVE